MFGKWLLGLLLPLALAAALGACENNNSVQPGVVNTAAQGGYRGETGRVVSIREVPVRKGNTGVSDGTLIGGGVGAVGGAIAGTAIDQNSTRRGIEVTVQKDNGQQVTIAQSDDGDVQMGDRVAIVYDRNGVAKAVRDTSGRRD
jgi:outer membrane lipoprotein SlyB